MSMCDFLIRRGVDINATDIYGNTALMIAAEKNCVDLCQTLIEKEADINAKGRNGGTALIIASLNGNTEICQMLIEKGADFSLIYNDDWKDDKWAGKNYKFQYEN